MIDQQGGGIGSGLPDIDMAWQSRQLVFVARGEAPYTLAWGSTKVNPMTQSSSQILITNQSSETNNNSMLSKAIWSDEAVTTSNLSSLETLKEPVNWRQILLWGVLVVAALMLIWMAVGLMKKMSDD